MDATTMAMVTCPGCGHATRWNAKYAGKRVKCKCGAVMSYPTNPPSALAKSQDLYDIAETPALADAEVPAPPAQAAVSTNVILDRLGAMPRKKQVEEDLRALKAQREREIDEANRFVPARDLYAPLAIIALGVMLAFVEAYQFAQPRASGFGDALPMVVIKVILAAGIMVLGMWFCCTALEVSFLGSFRLSLLRFMAIAVGPVALYGICTVGIGDLAGSMIGVFGSVAAYAVLFKLFMRTDLKDTAVCVLVTWILVAAAQYMAYKMDEAISGSWI